MGAAYSQDLRVRVLAAIDGGLSKMKAHRTFNVSRSTIDDWLHLREQTGSVQVVPSRRHGPPPAITDLEEFEAFAQRHCHQTLWQMKKAWFEEKGQMLSHNTFSLAMKRIGWTRKKSAGSTVSVWGPAAP
jgi:transposase